MRILIYNVLMYLLSPLWLAVVVTQSIKRRGGWKFLSARMGWQTLMRGTKRHLAKSVSVNTDSHIPTASTPRPLWFHAASVGEVKSMLPLLGYLTDAALPIHVTCTTPESFAIVRATRLDGLTSEYCPIDFYRSTSNLYKRLNPLALIIIETEIWPNLYSFANRHNVPLVIVNGRVSEKTLKAPRFVLNIYRQVLQHVTLILSRSETDSTNFTTLGVNSCRIKTIGNIKTYAGHVKQPGAVPELTGKRYLLAASTHDPEEQLLCDALLCDALLNDAKLLLVIAPRHVQRSIKIQQWLTQRNIKFATRSRSEPVTVDTRVYLADTTGEMDNLIANATMVFVGGSLADHGGHNVLEPALQGKPVLTGPYYKNFIAEVELLSSFNAVLVVNDAVDLAETCIQLINQPEQLKTLGESARQAIDSSAHVFEHYTRELDQLIEQWR